MRKTSLIMACALVVCALSAPARGGEPKTEEDKTMYALGLTFSRSLAPFGLTEAELPFVTAGIVDGVLGKEPKVDLNEYSRKIQALQIARAKTVAEAEKKRSQSFLDKAAAEEGATKTDSGLVYSEITPGTGKQPKATNTVKVHYHGSLTDGTVFDSSVTRGTPATFPLNRVVKCWTEGVQKMRVGGKSKLVCPSDIAYGDRGSPPKIKPGATLVFEVELLEIVK